MTLPILNEVVFDVLSEVYPAYSKIHNQVFVRVKDLPIEDKIRHLRQVHLNSLIKIRGVITKRTGVFNELMKYFLRCTFCSDITGPFLSNKLAEVKGKR